MYKKVMLEFEEQETARRKKIAEDRVKQVTGQPDEEVVDSMRRDRAAGLC